MDPLYSFTADSIVFFTGISLNDRFTQYRDFQRSVALQQNVLPGPSAIEACTQWETESVLLRSNSEIAPAKVTWNCRQENVFGNVVYQNTNSEVSEPIVYTPILSQMSNSSVLMSSHKVTKPRKRKMRLPPTKEELDDELDQYMTDIIYF